MADYAAGAVARRLGGSQVLRAEIRTIADMQRAVAAGLPYKSLAHVLLGFAMPDHRNMVQELVLPRTTRLRRMREKVLSVTESERLERVARLTGLAERTLGSLKAGEEFLTTPHPLLGGIPIHLASTELGARRVEAILDRLEYSLPV